MELPGVKLCLQAFQLLSSAAIQQLLLDFLPSSPCLSVWAMASGSKSTVESGMVDIMNLISGTKAIMGTGMKYMGTIVEKESPKRIRPKAKATAKRTILDKAIIKQVVLEKESPKGIRPKAKATAKRTIFEKAIIKQEVPKKEQKVKQEVEEGLGSPLKQEQGAASLGQQMLAKRALKAAFTRQWKEAKRAQKQEGVIAQEIEKRFLFLVDYASLPAPFQDAALQLCRATLRTTLYKDFLLTKTKGNGWKYQWGDAHVLFLTTFKLELAKEEAEVSRWEVKLGALRKSLQHLQGPQPNPHGKEKMVGSALVDTWKKAAQEVVQESWRKVELLEGQVVKEIEDIGISSSKALSLG